MADADPTRPVDDAVRVPIGTRAFVLTVSDGVASGSRQDEAGVVLADRLGRLGFTVERGVSADDGDLISVAIRSALDQHVLVVTTGGTGLTPRDVTPQATAALLDYEIPGLAEAMRAAGRAKTPMADLSRGVVGVARRRLVVNVPGSPRAALESLAALEPTLRHALETLAGAFDHGAAAASRPDLPDPSAASSAGTGAESVPSPVGPPPAPFGSASTSEPDFDPLAALLPTALPGGRPFRSNDPTPPDEPRVIVPEPPAPGDTADPWRDLPPSAEPGDER